MDISKRLPGWKDLTQVYGIIVLVIYSWTILSFLWMFPSWRNILTAGEILAVLAFSLASAFAESLVVLCVPALVGLVLPRTWFGNLFVARGAALALSGLAYVMFLDRQLQSQSGFPELGLPGWVLLAPLAVIVLLVYLPGRIKLLRKFLESLADRATIFLYIMVPVSAISVLAALAGLTP